MKAKDVIFLIKGEIKKHYGANTVKEGVEALTRDVLKAKQINGKTKILEIISKDNEVSIEELSKLTK